MLNHFRRAFHSKASEEAKDTRFSFEWELFSPEPLDYRQFQWLTWGRLVLVLFLLAAIFLFSNYLGPIGRLPDVLVKVAYLSLAALAVTYGYIQWYKTGKWLRQLSLLQISLDILFVAAVVYVTGMAFSPFLFLFPVIVVAACLLQGRQGGQFAAVACTALYVGIVGLDRAFSLRDTSNLIVFFVNIIVVYITALLVGVLAERLRRAERRLSVAVVDLRRLREMERHLADNLVSGLVMLNTEGHILALNRRAEAILGVRSTDYAGRLLSELWPAIGPDFDEIRAWFAKTEGLRREILHNAPSGEILLGLSGFAMQDERGGLLGYGIIFQDLTEIRRQEERLRRVERLASLGEMAAGMAHEIRNPLASISGVVEFLQEGGMVTADGAKLLEILQREIQRLTELTQAFLLYARPERGGEQSVNLLNAINETLGLLSSRKLAGLHVNIQVPSELCVVVNPTQFRQVLWNLLLNAVQAMMPKLEKGEEATLFVGVEPVSQVGVFDAVEAKTTQKTSEQKALSRVSLIVEDSGVGIPEGQLSRIFEPFFTTRGDGTGLGLSIVQRLVEAWGGSVECSSQEGVGTRFRVLLPVSDSPKT